MKIITKVGIVSGIVVAVGGLAYAIKKLVLDKRNTQTPFMQPPKTDQTLGDATLLGSPQHDVAPNQR